MLVIRIRTLRITKYKVTQTLINILANLLPYYFTKFAWGRSLIYQSLNKYNPIDLDILDKELQDSKDYISIDLYGYYEDTFL